MKAVIVILLTLAATAAQAQQYRNYEVQPDGTGGYYGTYGNRNFEVNPQNGGRVVRRPGAIHERSYRRPGDVRANPNNCVVDGSGTAVCR